MFYYPDLIAKKVYPVRLIRKVEMQSKALLVMQQSEFHFGPVVSIRSMNSKILPNQRRPIRAR